jgi:hypothetical protein
VIIDRSTEALGLDPAATAPHLNHLYALDTVSQVANE